MDLLKESWNGKGKKKILKFIGKMYCTSVFLLYKPDGESTESPFQYRMRGWLDISKAEVQPDKVYKINPSSSGVLFMGDKMGEHKQTNKKKVPQEKKNNYSLRNPFFLQVVAKVF